LKPRRFLHAQGMHGACTVHMHIRERAVNAAPAEGVRGRLALRAAVAAKLCAQVRASLFGGARVLARADCSPG
jgi:hypothetical protein